MQTADNVFKNLFLFIIYLICFVPGVSNPGLVCYKFIFFFLIGAGITRILIFNLIHCFVIIEFAVWYFP